MPSALPDPVLALSLASVQKLNNVDLDQLANLWNVFSKCKESLESGRRLENLSWRLWFREAHLLPPDTSLSDLADFTPLDTPLMSRRGSITGSFSSARPTNATLPSLISVDGRLAAVNDAPLSDPEDEDWSDEDDKEDNIPPSTIASTESRGRTPTRLDEGLPETIAYAKQSPAKKSAPIKAAAAAAASSSTNHIDNLTPAGLSIGLGDRKRAVSSSSAFGSRARVKQHNTARRRRPLSFQQAIESLLDSSKDFCQNGQHSSLPICEGTAEIGVDLGSGDQAIAIDVQQNSAPAEFNQLNTPSFHVISPGLSSKVMESNQQEEDRRSMPPPLVVPSRSKEIIEEGEEKKSKESKFFMAGQSVDDSASSVSGSLYSPKQKRREDSPESIRNGQHKTTSEVVSERSQRQATTHQSHGKNTSHGIAAGSKTRSAIGLSRAGAIVPSIAKGKHPNRVTSGDSAEINKKTDKQHKDTTKTRENSRQPVKFTLSGGDDDGDDEYTDEDSSGPTKESRKTFDLQKGKGKREEKENDDEDEWSSASSTDSEELQRRVKEEKKQEEIERQQSMFQKMPIKSASTVDVRHASRRSSAPMERSNSKEPPSPPAVIQPVRGLLSSLFHPQDEPHPPPGQLAGRPHASAADLRMKPSQQNEIRIPTKSQANFNMTAMPSTTQVPSVGVGALKLSKSAVALPVLSTLGSRSEVKKAQEVKGSRESAVFDDDEEEESGEGSEGGGGVYGTSEALARLNQLAYQKKERQREGKRHSYNKRQSSKGLNVVEVAPEMDEETLMAKRKTSAVSTPASSRSQIPETSMPQTPRTTRRNMLRDELSESLRQSLLWERQSRNRMLGIGALDSNPRNNNQASTTATSATADSRARSTNRNQTVLGSGQLRPLTTSSSKTNLAEQQQRQQRRLNHQQSNTIAESDSNNTHANTAHRSYTGDFHHAGW